MYAGGILKTINVLRHPRRGTDLGQRGGLVIEAGAKEAKESLI
jgi:hypothetical protein